jgi:hypothetical protein
VNTAADAVTDEYGQVQPKGKPGHDRLRWLSQKRAEKRSCIRRSKARESEAMPLVKRTPMALEMDGCALLIFA